MTRFGTPLTLLGLKNKPQSPERGSVLVGGGRGPGVLLDSGPPALLLFPQTQILREVALDLGSRGGVQGSLSSTPASRGAPPPPVPPVPVVQRGPRPPLHTPQHHPLFSPSKKPASGVDFDDP